jgi:hypothetical protein
MMSKNIITGLIMLFFSLAFTACKNEMNEVSIPNRGFFEYQYEYQITVDDVLVTKKAYERINVNDAFFVVNTESEFPDSLLSLGFRRVDVYVFSDGFSGLNTTSIGGSYVKIQLADSLAFDLNPDRVLEYSYTLRYIDGFYTVKQPVCLGFTGNMTLLGQDETTGNYVFDKQVSGQLTKRMHVFNLGNGYYELMTNGLFDSKIYNFYYVGKIRQEEKAPVIN